MWLASCRGLRSTPHVIVREVALVFSELRSMTNPTIGVLEIVMMRHHSRGPRYMHLHVVWLTTEGEASAIVIVEG